MRHETRVIAVSALLTSTLLLLTSAAAAPLDLVDTNVVETGAWSYTMTEVGDYLNVTNSTITAGGDITVSINRPDSFLRKYLPVTICDSALTTTAGKIAFPVAQYSNHTTDVQVVRSTFSSTDIFKLGMWGNGWDNELVRFRAEDSTFCWNELEVLSHVDAKFTNCTIVGPASSEGGAFGHGTASNQKASTALFENCTITNFSPYIGRHESAVKDECIISGGTYHTRKFRFGSYPGRLRLTDGVNVTVDPGEGTIGQLNGSGSELILEKGSKVRVTAMSGTYNRNIYFGWSSGCDATLIIDGGEWTERCGSGHYFGLNGQGTLLVKDGCIEGQNFRAGYGACSKGVITSYIHQVGGRITANCNGSRSQYSSVVAGYNATHYGHIILEGGLMQTPKIVGVGEYGYLTVNGGTVEPWWDIATDFKFLRNFARAEIGAKGFTVDNKTCSCHVYQDITNMKGQKGVFRKIGAKLMKLQPPSAWDVAETRVEEGTLQLVNTNETLNTHLVVTNATLSLEGDCETLVLDALTATNATFTLDAGDTITVPADKLSLDTLQVSYVTTPAAGTTNGFLVTTGGAISDANKRVLRRALLQNAIGEDENARVLISYDAQTGTTTVQIVVNKNVAPLTSKTVLESGTVWSTGTWSAGIPDISKIAVVADKTVTVDAGATAGALELGGAATSLAGEKALEIAAEQGAAAIYGFATAASVSAPLIFDSQVAITNAADTVLSVSGDIDGAGYEKTGKGRLELSGTNTFFGAQTLADGRVLVTSAAALNADPAKPTLTLTGGTLTFDEPQGGEIRVETPIVVKTTEVKGSAVMECRTPVTLANWQTTQQGGFIKRGPAKLTIEVRDGMALSAKVARDWSTYEPLNSFTFDADGTAPYSGPLGNGKHSYGEFNIAEGEVAFVPPAGATSVPKIKEPCMVVPQLICNTATNTIRLTIDGVDLDNSGVFSSFKACASLDACTAKSPVVSVLNGGRLYASTFYGQHYGYQTGRPIWAVTNGTLQAGACWLAWINCSGVNLWESSKAIYRMKDAAFKVDSGIFEIDGGVDCDFENTYVGPTDETQYGTLRVPDMWHNHSRANGDFVFREGSVFRVGTFSFPASEWVPDKVNWPMLRFVFNNAEWQYGAGDWTFQKAWFNADYLDRVKVEMRGKGVILKPAAGTTFTTEFPFTGEGGLIVDGPGTVKFPADTLKFTGAAEVRQGTLDAGGQSVAVSLTNLTGENVPTLKDCAVDGRVLIDMTGVSVKEGDAFTVANVSGSTTARFRAENLPANLRGVFETKDGVVTMRIIRKPGIILFMR